MRPATARSDEGLQVLRRVPLLGGIYELLLDSPFQKIHAEAAAERTLLGERADYRPLWVMILVSLVLVFQEYYGDRPAFVALFPVADGGHFGALGEFAWWSGAKVVGYFVVPAIACRVVGIRLSDCGLGLAGATKHVGVYVLFFVVFVPVIVIASGTAAFQHTYPFYKLASRSWVDLLAWEALYASSFFALEFFFRGFMLFVLRRSLGANAIFVMIVPYCMIHFHKPVAEVSGAIFAGILLGTLALRTRSIWCGVLIHVSVAWTMDLLALWRTTGFPGSGRFIG